jgi:Cu/Ag efflux pump CusA
MAALAPLANGQQEGGEILQPLAIVVLGGMPVALIATLVVLPALYVIAHGHQRVADQPVESHELTPREEVVR